MRGRRGSEAQGRVADGWRVDHNASASDHVGGSSRRLSRACSHCRCGSVFFWPAAAAVPSATDGTDGRLPVFAGIPPLAYLVEQIGGEHVKVDVLVQPGQDPHTFEPTPQQIRRPGQGGDLLQDRHAVRDGALGEGAGRQPAAAGRRCHAGRRETPDGRPVLCGSRRRRATISETERGEPDPHVWLSPPLLKIHGRRTSRRPCARPIRRTSATISGTWRRCSSGSMRSHRRIERMLAPYRGRSFYVFHPGFGYFADAYGLKQEAVEAGGRSPTPKQLRALIEKAQADGVKTIFVQPQYAPQSAQVVAEAIGGKVVPINGLGKDVLADIEDIATKIETR